jgi:hypothetical protein
MLWQLYTRGKLFLYWYDKSSHIENIVACHGDQSLHAIQQDTSGIGLLISGFSCSTLSLYFTETER